MNGSSWLLSTLLAGVVLYMAWRVRTLLHIRRRDRRWFLCFWIWPLLWFLLENLVPLHHSPTFTFSAVELSFLLATGLDFFYYFGLKTPKVRQQVLSGFFLIPCLGVGFRDRLSTAPAVGLAPPHYGEALVWTDRIWRPRTYYFMDPKTKVFQKPVDQAHDPNYGKAVFAPLNGRLLRVDDAGFAHIAGEGRWEGVRLALGPLIPGSLRVGPGERMIQHQPLGLSANTGSIPGIQLRMLQGGLLGFQNCFSGRWLAMRYRMAFPKRNHHLLSDAPKRFRFYP